MADTSASSNTGDTAFYDNCIPSLEAGIYNITIKSGIDNLSTGSYFNNPVTQQFEVRAPQFTLASQEIHSVFPPDSSSSTYGETLPYIVFEKRVIPWERYLDKKDTSIPWLALIVFKEGELTVDKETPSSLISSTVQQLLQADPDVIKPDIPASTISSDILQSTCQSIKISADAFKALVPRLKELKYLAHVRQINVKSQAIKSTEDMGWFSVVLGNRLLKSNSEGSKYFVHLVSLEGMKEYLTAVPVFPKKASNPSLEKDVQLVSLYNWSFVSQPQKGESFDGLVENFAAQAQGKPENLLLRRYVNAPANPDDSMKKVLSRLQNGYVALEYQTPSGENTFAWYRGPFSPVIAQDLPRLNEDYHYPSADSAMIYDSENGLFDQSYSAAWSIGRALALADPSFSQALFIYRKNAFRTAAKIADRISLAQINTDMLSTKESLNYNTSDKLNSLISDGLGDTLSQLFRSAVPVATPLEKAPEAVKKNAVENVRQYLAHPVIQDLVRQQASEYPDTVARWIASRMLLYDVPFNHLVPDQMMLPVESLRFFYLDKNWISVMIDGALSIGVQSSKDIAVNSIIKPVIHSAALAKVSGIRNKLIGLQENNGTASSDMPFSGILIRSAVVSGWPGLEIKAFKNSTEIKALRTDRLSSTVLLCLFIDIPDTITIAQPQQGLQFGIEDGDILTLRSLTSPVGKPKSFPAAGGFAQFMRATVNEMGASVLNINADDGSVVQTMQLVQYLNKKIGPAEFAIQMVKAPERISFILTA